MCDVKVGRSAGWGAEPADPRRGRPAEPRQQEPACISTGTKAPHSAPEAAPLACCWQLYLAPPILRDSSRLSAAPSSSVDPCGRGRGRWPGQGVEGVGVGAGMGSHCSLIAHSPGILHHGMRHPTPPDTLLLKILSPIPSFSRYPPGPPSPRRARCLKECRMLQPRKQPQILRLRQCSSTIGGQEQRARESISQW